MTATPLDAAAVTRRTVERAFADVPQSGFTERFTEALADDLVFTATGTSPVAGRYESKTEYQTNVLARLHERLATPIRARVEQVIVEGEWATVRFRSHGVQGVNGIDFSMEYCWLIRVVDGRITEITGFYDTKKMNDLFA
ncbi:ketosteroid isomerase-like protein [Streptomyces tendae]|uniref:nuclear transport factor 2 family protein n=1 Tax=Streptomyces tendae TaxID=1932 RepID=UPI003833DE8F